MADRRGDAFQTALDEARRMDRAPDDGEAEPGKRPRIGVGVPLGRAPGSGGKARFGLALDWTDEPAERPAAQPKAQPGDAAPSPADTSAEIATELGLGEAAQTLSQLTSHWRRFVWRNHPDRQPPERRERANARVAIANALYEQARGALAKPR
jgi:hypothetical protein